ncbi:GNAT family N-acetyltransferase [Streptomyces albulus]|nr:GNAT family N-acetyltransferase [Streptomyces noursei]
MTTLSVRPLTVEDWALYRTVRLAALADAPEAFGSTWESEQAFTEDRWRERLARRNQFVAQDGDRTYGLIGIVPVEAGRAELVSMWVHPDGRGRGVGTSWCGRRCGGRRTMAAPGRAPGRRGERPRGAPLRPARLPAHRAGAGGAPGRTPPGVRHGPHRTGRVSPVPTKRPATRRRVAGRFRTSRRALNHRRPGDRSAPR